MADLLSAGPTYDITIDSLLTDHAIKPAEEHIESPVVYVTFRIRTQVPKGYIVCLVGSGPEMGNWDPRDAKTMTFKRQARYWEKELKLRSKTRYLYRYFICKLLWNSRCPDLERRKLVTPSNITNVVDICILEWESFIHSRIVDTSKVIHSLTLPVSYFSVFDNTIIGPSVGWLVDLTSIHLRFLGPRPITIYGLEDARITFSIKCLPLDYTDIQRATALVRQVVPGAKSNSALARFVAIAALPVKDFEPRPANSSVADLHPYFATEMYAVKLDETTWSSRPQDNIGTNFRNGQHLSFQIYTSQIDALGFKFEFYVELDGIHRLIGYSYLFPLAHLCASKTVPILGRQSRAIGELNVDYLAVLPLPCPKIDMQISYQNYWKRRQGAWGVGEYRYMSLTGPNTSSCQEIALVQENTLASIRSVSFYGKHMAKFQVQLCKNMIPVIYGDFRLHMTTSSRKSATSEVFEGSVKDLTLSQLQSSSLLEFSEQVASNEENVKKELEPFPSVEQALTTIDPSLSYIIEVLYPQQLENGEMEIKPYFDHNLTVDIILNVVFKHAGGRKIYFCSSNADTCIMLQMKQNRFPVLFNCHALSSSYPSYRDLRTRSLEAAIHFAHTECLLGVDLLSDELVKDIKLIYRAHQLGLVVFSWSGGAEDSKVTELLKLNRVDGVMSKQITFTSVCSIRSATREVFQLSRQVGRIALQSTPFRLHEYKGSSKSRSIVPPATPRNTAVGLFEDAKNGRTSIGSLSTPTRSNLSLLLQHPETLQLEYLKTSRTEGQALGGLEGPHEEGEQEERHEVKTVTISPSVGAYSASKRSRSKDQMSAALQKTKSYGYQNKLGQRRKSQEMPIIGIEEVKRLHFYRQLVTEFFGTFMLVSLGCGCLNPIRPPDHDAGLSMASILLGWGFTVSTCVWTIAHVSGCFLNPAVTISMCVNRRIPVFRCIAYIIVQLPGAVAGSAFHTYLRGDKLETTCQTLLNRDFGVDEVKGFTVEFYLTFILLFFVFATTDHHRHDHNGSHALMVGTVIFPLVNVGAELTGAGMNPARSFGPAFVHGNWDAHWVYWAAPISGATCGGAFYDLFMSERMVHWTRYLQMGDSDDEGDE